ncbi:MAG: hypothetical protein NVSMB47_11240 [Polyangiales bacterium]
MRRRISGSRRALALGAVLVLAPFGCGSPQRSSQLDGLHDELARIQRDHEVLERRVGMLEARDVAQNVANEPADGAPIKSASSDPKALKVVKLEPAAAGTPAAPPAPAPVFAIDDDSPRPMLKIGPDGVEETYPDAGSAKASKASSALPARALKDYESAFALVKSKKWQLALDAFAGFVVRWPDHPYVANALYWRGECYFALAQFGAAEGQLEGLLAGHPASAKVPDALLKLGLTERKLGADAKAKAAFARLRKEFPSSEAAKKLPPEDPS